MYIYSCILFFFFQAEDGIRDADVTGVQTCALPIFRNISAPDDIAVSAGGGVACRRPKDAGARFGRAPHDVLSIGRAPHDVRAVAAAAVRTPHDVLITCGRAPDDVAARGVSA